MKGMWGFLLLAIGVPAFTAAQAPHFEANAKSELESVKPQLFPERKLEFAVSESDPSVTLSAITTLPQCDSRGYLFLDMLDPKDLKKHELVAISGKESQRYLLSNISDIHDLFVFGYSVTDSAVFFLVRGTKEVQSTFSTGNSPAGYAWSGYHQYAAEFKRDGTYKGSTELPIGYDFFRFAALSSGELLVAGYDNLNRTPQLLFLSSSGKVIRAIDMPASRKTSAQHAPNGSLESDMSVRKLVDPIQFSRYGENVLVWTANGSDPIVEIGPGGKVREIPFEVPEGYAFADIISSNDRLVAHFRRKEVAENAPFTRDTYSYFELRPQDGSILSKLSITGAAPQSLACENDGHYLTYKADKDNKLVLFRAERE